MPSAVAADIARAYDYIYEPTSLHTGNGNFVSFVDSF